MEIENLQKRLSELKLIDNPSESILEEIISLENEIDYYYQGNYSLLLVDEDF